MVGALPQGILAGLVLHGGVLGQSELLALVEVCAAGQAQHEQGGGARSGQAELGVGLGVLGADPGVGVHVGGVGQAGGVAHDVVVGQHPGGGRPHGAVFAQGDIDDAAQLVGVPSGAQEGEVKGLAHLVGAHVLGGIGLRGHPGLGDQEDVLTSLVQDTAPLAVDVVDPGLVEGRSDVGQLLVGRVFVRGGGNIPTVGAEVVVGQALGLDQAMGDVHAEALDTALHPEAQEGAEVLVDVRVGPVEVGLLGCEQVEVVPAPVLAAAGERLHRLPGRPTEERAPVVRGTVVTVAEDVAVTLGRPRARLQGGTEPLVLVGGVVGDQVDDDADAGLVEVGDEGVEVLQGAVLGGQIEVIRDVVAGIHLGRGVEGREPHGVHAEGHQMVHVLPDPLDIADPVAVGVGEGAGVDLIDDGITPPGVDVGAWQEALRAGTGRGHERVLGRAAALRPGG